MRPESPCPRCGKPFIPKQTGMRTVPWTRHCDLCCLRNIIDGLGMPTPPGLLDVHSKRPALTYWEFQAELEKPIPDEP